MVAGKVIAREAPWKICPAMLLLAGFVAYGGGWLQCRGPNQRHCRDYFLYRRAQEAQYGRVVEAAGVEPASLANLPAATTCLVRREFSAER